MDNMYVVFNESVNAKSFRCTPETTDSFMKIASRYEQTNEKLAETFYTKAMENNCVEAMVKLATKYNNHVAMIRLGDIYYSLDNKEIAMQSIYWYKKSLNIKFDNQIVLQRIAEMYSTCVGNKVEAVKYYEYLRTLGNTQIMVALADIYYFTMAFNSDLSDEEIEAYENKAIECYKIAIANHHSGALPFYHIGMVYEGRGETDEACKYYMLASDNCCPDALERVWTLTGNIHDKIADDIAKDIDDIASGDITEIARY